MKTLLIDDMLHKRLKMYCVQNNLVLSKFVSNLIHKTLVGNELDKCEEYQKLWYEHFDLLDRKIPQDSEEYKNWEQKINQYWNKKEKDWYETGI